MRKKIHTKKWRKMVKAIKKKGGAKNAEAVATSRLGSKSFKKTSRRKSNKSKASKVRKMMKLAKSKPRKRKKRR